MPARWDAATDAMDAIIKAVNKAEAVTVTWRSEAEEAAGLRQELEAARVDLWSTKTSEESTCAMLISLWSEAARVYDLVLSSATSEAWLISQYDDIDLLTINQGLLLVGQMRRLMPLSTRSLFPPCHWPVLSP
jgi:hypothetical protein